MDIICAPSGIVGIDHPGQGIQDLKKAGFENILLDLAAAWLIQRWTSMDMITALFASAPGGVTDMALIAEDMGADSVKVTGMHTVRLIGVISLYPALISVLLRFL